jgi:hypothetical protein
MAAGGTRKVAAGGTRKVAARGTRKAEEGFGGGI